MDELKASILSINKSRFIVSSILIVLTLNCVLIVDESDFSRVDKFVVNSLMLFILIVSNSRMVKVKELVKEFDFFLPEVRERKLKRLESFILGYSFVEFLLLLAALLMIATKDVGGVLDSSNMMYLIFVIIGVLNLGFFLNEKSMKRID